MSVLRLRALPVEVEAVQWRGDNMDEVRECFDDLVQLVGGSLSVRSIDGGWFYVPLGYYVVCGVHGELYPLDPDVLSESYEVLP